MSIRERLQAVGVELPEPPQPVASYVPAVRTGNLVFSSGQVPSHQGMLRFRGSVPVDISEKDARDAARIAALNALAAIATVADLDTITRVVRLTGYVASSEGFTNQPAVINGASDLLLEVFGDAGQHSRTSVGVYQLPLGVPVEIDLVVEVAG